MLSYLPFNFLELPEKTIVFFILDTRAGNKNIEFHQLESNLNLWTQCLCDALVATERWIFFSLSLF